ncbi:MAG: copper-binding protein [Gammaproteobacteria bacterium]|nr:copper-binding protein [Gammaproteobacteria bacterium]
MKLTTVKSVAAAALAAGAVQAAGAQQVSVLDPAAHPASPAFESPFPESILPLDATLSWKNRFNGNEEFNENETLADKFAIAARATNSSGSGSESSVPGADNPGAAMDATGVVQQVKLEQGKVKIKHGPIERLGMPAMTMLFKVDDGSMLERLEKGQTVEFSVDSSSGGFAITRIAPLENDNVEIIQKASAMTPQAMDARGIVKSIRRAQGKVKIEHGPIDRMGMPAMTMMFKVSDPTLLEGIEMGSTIDFSVDNSSGGFVITGIKPAS